MNIIITGTSRGIGKELSEHFLNQGHNVSGCSRNAATIDHSNYLHHELSVDDESKVTSMVRNTRRQFGSVDVLINNAGIASMNHLSITPLNTLKNIFNTNVFGSFLFLRECSKVMKKGGRIVNFTTVATPLELEGEAAYAASKAAVENLTRVSSKELAGLGVTVNAVGPTPVPTDLIKNVSKEKMDALVGRQAIARFGTVQDIINVLEFFISEKSDFITGQIIYLGGV